MADRTIIKLDASTKSNSSAKNRSKQTVHWKNCTFDTGETLKIPEECVLRFGLKKDTTLSEKEFDRIRAEVDVARGKDKLLRLLSYSARSEKELKQRLRKSGIRHDSAQTVIRDLKRLKLVDDEDFARKFVHDLIRRKPAGEFLIKAELRKKGIADSIIEKTVLQEFDETDQVELARKGVQQWISRHQRKPAEDSGERRQKIAKFLYQRGFAWSTIDEVIGDGSAIS